MADTRTYVRVHDGMPDHPKLLKAGALVGVPGGSGMAGWMYQCSLSWSSRQRADGVMPAGMVDRLTDFANAQAIASALLAVGLWHEANHTCPRCPQGYAGSYVIHDYLEHQRSAAEIDELSRKRKEAGQRGGKASVESRGAQASAQAFASPSASSGLETGEKQNGTIVSDRDREEELTTSRRGNTPPPPQRLDVERVCVQLADAIEANGSKRPTITEKWRTEARLMLDRDKRTVEQVVTAIAWCQNNSFWRKNILSMPKLREKYDQMRLAATDEQKRARTTPNNRLAGADTRSGEVDWSDPKVLEF